MSDLARLNSGVLQAMPTNRTFAHLVYLDSRQCPGIQLADLASYVRQRPSGVDQGYGPGRLLFLVGPVSGVQHGTT